MTHQIQGRHHFGAIGWNFENLNVGRVGLEAEKRPLDAELSARLRNLSILDLIRLTSDSSGV
jgi:hypothetical protein